MLKIVLAAGIALLLSSSAVQAQQGGLVKACGADVKAQCAGVERGGGRIVACLKEHAGTVSDTCKQAMGEATAGRQACRADVKQQCAGVQPGGGRIRACLKEHAATVSDACKPMLARAAAKG